MSAVVKKYIKFILDLDDLSKKYRYECFKNEIQLDLKYITLILFNMKTERLIECASSEIYKFLQTEEFELTLSEENEAGIVSVYDQPFNGYCYTEMNYFHYSLKRDDFKNIAINYKLFFDNNISYFYLILLSNNRVVLQKELHDALFKTPQRWLNYVKIAYEKNDLRYKEVERTSGELNWFFWFYFEPENREKMLEYYDNFKKNGQIPEHISLAEIERIMQESFLIKNQKDPVYFVKNDLGAIEVRKSILSLRHVLLGRAEDGTYEIKDECGIGVFDFLEEFALGFSPERFLQEHQDADSGEEFYSIHGHIEIICSKDKNFILLNLGKAPYEFEYIERERARYFERTEVEMQLDSFVDLMNHWIELKEKHTVEIYFTQQDDGMLVIRENEILTADSHNNYSKIEFSSEDLCKPQIVGEQLNHNGSLKSSDALKVIVIAERQGCQLVSMQIADQKPFPKTWYPAHWDAKMVYDKIREALGSAPFFNIRRW